jgi:TolB protein
LNGSDDDYLVIVDLKGKELAQYNLWRLTNGNTKEADGFNWSPDSKKITFLGNFNVNMDNGWYILDLKSGKITNLIFEGALCGADTPGWFPDGEKLLFTAANCPEQLPVNIFDYRIYTINSDGSNLKSLTDASVGNAHWSPDGKFIIFDKYTDQGSEIFIMNADGTNQRNLFGNQSHLSFIQWITP